MNNVIMSLLANTPITGANSNQSNIRATTNNGQSFSQIIADMYNAHADSSGALSVIANDKYAHLVVHEYLPDADGSASLTPEHIAYFKERYDFNNFTREDYQWFCADLSRFNLISFVEDVRLTNAIAYDDERHLIDGWPRIPDGHFNFATFMRELCEYFAEREKLDLQYEDADFINRPHFSDKLSLLFEIFDN